MVVEEEKAKEDVVGVVKEVVQYELKEKEEVEVEVEEEDEVQELVEEVEPEDVKYQRWRWW